MFLLYCLLQNLSLQNTVTYEHLHEFEIHSREFLTMQVYMFSSWFVNFVFSFLCKPKIPMILLDIPIIPTYKGGYQVFCFCINDTIDTSSFVNKIRQYKSLILYTYARSHLFLFLFTIYRYHCHCLMLVSTVFLIITLDVIVTNPLNRVCS